MPLMTRVAFDHRKLSPKWSIQGARAGMGIPSVVSAAGVALRGAVATRPSTLRGTARVGETRRLSFRLDSGFLDDLGPAIDLGLEIFAELRGLAADRHHALLVELSDHVGRGDRLGDLVAQALRDRGRRMRRGEQGEILHHLE